MGDMTEYYRQISEIQKAVREREMYRLELEKERLLKTQRREKRHEELRNKVKSLHKELVNEEMEAAQRVRKLLAQVEAVTREHKLLEAQTEKLRIKKRQYEAQLEKDFTNIKTETPNYYFNSMHPALAQGSSLVPHAGNATSLGINVSGVFPQMTTLTNSIPQGSSTPIPRPSMSSLHPFPAAVPQVSPITPSTLLSTSQWPEQNPGNKLGYGTDVSHGNFMAPHFSLSLNQQEELARRNSSLVNGMHISPAPPTVPGTNSHIQKPYEQNFNTSQTLAEQMTQNSSMSNSLSVAQSQPLLNANVNKIPTEHKTTTVSFNESPVSNSHSIYNKLQSVYSLSSQQVANIPSNIPTMQSVNNESMVYSNNVQRQDSVPSQPQESAPMVSFQQPTENTQNNDALRAPNSMQNINPNMKIEQPQMPSEPSPTETYQNTNHIIHTSQQSDEASTSTGTGLSTRPTVTGLSEEQSIDSAHASNEMEESLSPSSQEQSSDISQERNKPSELVEEKLPPPTTAQQKETSCPNLSKLENPIKSNPNDLKSNEKTKDSIPIPSEHETNQAEREAKLKSENPQQAIIGPTSPLKNPTTKENSLNLQKQKPSQSSGSVDNISSLPTQDKKITPLNTSIAIAKEKIAKNDQPSPVQMKKEPLVPTPSSQNEEKQKEVKPTITDKPTEKSSISKEIESEKKDSQSTHKNETGPNTSSVKVPISQPSASSLTDSSSVTPTTSFPTKTSESKIQMQEDDNDSDFFDRDVPVTATRAYQAMVSGTGLRGQPVSTESDSDDLEGQMSAMIAKKDVQKSRPTFKPFASSIPSLRPAPPGTDTDSVDSVEAAIQAAMNKSREQGDKTAPLESSTTSNPSENTSAVKETAAPAPKPALIKPRPSAALQLNLDSDSESGGVSAGMDGSDDDDFDFYD